MQRLLQALARWLKNRGSNSSIPHEDGGAYLERFFIYRVAGKKGTLLHRFYDSDQIPHDHPWDNRSILLKGTYLEHVYETGGQGAPPRLLKVVRRTAPCITGWRRAEQIHRIEIPQGQEGKVWSLFIYGPRVRQWLMHYETGPGLPFHSSSPDKHEELIGTFFPRRRSQVPGLR